MDWHQKFSPDVIKGPLHVILQSTSLCNLNCSYCYLPEDMRSQNQVMSFDLVDLIFKKIFESKYTQTDFSIEFHLGEPLTLPISYYQQLMSIVDKHNTKGLKTRYVIQTNATLVTEEWAKFLKDNNFSVGVSIDGPERFHNANRQTWGNQGSHQAALKGLDILRQHDVPLHLICVVSEEGLDYPEEYFQFFLDQQFKAVGVNAEYKVGANLEDSYETDQTVARYQQFLERFADLYFQHGAPFEWRELMRLGLVGRFGFMHPSGQSNLTLPYLFYSITASGDFTFFSGELLTTKDKDGQSFALGNIRDVNLDEAIALPKFKLLYTQIEAGVEKCRQQCEYFEICGGGSPPEKYAEHQRFDVTETQSCKLHKKALWNALASRLFGEPLVDDACQEKHLSLTSS